MGTHPIFESDFDCLTEKLGMDLSDPKVKISDKLAIYRKFFFGGFAFLPWLWLVNGVWFFREAYFKEPFDEQIRIRKYVMYSIIGATVWIAGLTAWNCVFQMNRASWGATGDVLSAYIPVGIP